MDWIYSSRTGRLYLGGLYVGTGYSGTLRGRNNPELESAVALGPIPRGKYHIGPEYVHPKLGPVVMNLDPIGHTALGRSAFRIHGDNKTNDASHGCIIMNRTIREMISKNDTKILEVV